MNAITRRRWLRRWRQNRTNINRRELRDSADPLSLEPKFFEANYKVTKQMYSFLCSLLVSRLSAPHRCTSIKPEIKILITLNFLGTGRYQKPIGQDWLVPVSQPTASRCIQEVVEVLNDVMPLFINFPSNEEERNKIKQGFYDKYGMPDVLGCVDGTLIGITAPLNHPNEAAFLSRGGFYAINTVIICDSDLKINGICAKFGGAAPDSFIWESWSLSQYIEEAHANGMTGWILGDMKYPQRSCLMTPIVHILKDTPGSYYNIMHTQTRVCIKNCINLLKSRWRCLSYRVLHYQPVKCAKIINACAVLHNICLNDSVKIDFKHTEDLNEDDDMLLWVNSTEGYNARQILVNLLWENHLSSVRTDINSAD